MRCPTSCRAAYGRLSKAKRPKIGENGLLKLLAPVITEQLSHVQHEPVAKTASATPANSRSRTLKGEFGELPIEIPCDRLY